MPTIITMPDALYRTVRARFNPTYLNQMSGPGAFNPIPAIDGSSNVYWQAELSFTVSNLATFLLFRRFVMKMRGGKVLCRIYDPTMTAEMQSSQPRGVGGVTTTVNVAANAVAGAYSVTLKNLEPSETGVFLAGDMIGIGENLFVIEDDANSDGDGEATVALGVPLRHGVAIDDPVTTVKPTGLFRIVSGGQDLGVGIDRVGEQFTLAFMEVPDFEG